MNDWVERLDQNSLNHVGTAPCCGAEIIKGEVPVYSTKNDITFQGTSCGPFIGPRLTIRGPDLPAELLTEGIPPPSTPFRADEIEAFRHRNCPSFTVTRTSEGLQIDCLYHKGD